jgi:hypothetical protein
MTKLFLFVAIGFSFTACSSGSSTGKNNSDTAKTDKITQQKKSDANSILADTIKVKKWLIAVIEDFTNGEPGIAFENLQKSLTADYLNYKQDALNLEYDNSDTALTVDSFKKKWQHKYNTRYVGEGGYIISSQDNGKVKVATCSFMENKGQNATLYKVVIEDLDNKSKFHRDIKVIAQNGKLLIDDVVEYD